VEAIILAGGKAERLGAAAGGRPKALVPVAGRPLAAYQVAQLVQAGVTRVIVSCAAGDGAAFEQELGTLGTEIVAAEEPERLGRGGGLRFAARLREESGPVYALNGDELIDLDFRALLEGHRMSEASATIVVAPLPTAFSVVRLAESDTVDGFEESPNLPYWVHAGVNVIGADALERLPERGDLEATTLPELAAEGRLRAHRHEGLWLTVNTPKDLRRAEEYVAAHPEWLPAPT
jgi:NDP-sugar pyrophosphorylase family protein